MAVKRITTIDRWICLSTDTKPTENVNPGSECLEADTLKNYVYTGGSWVEHKYMVAQESGASATAWTANGSSAANTAQTISMAAPGAGKRHVITGYFVGIYNAAADTDVVIEIRDGATTKFTDYIGYQAPRGERVGLILPRESYIRCTENTAANLYIAAAGAVCRTFGTLFGFTENVPT